MEFTVILTKKSESPGPARRTVEVSLHLSVCSYSKPARAQSHRRVADGGYGIVVTGQSKIELFGIAAILALLVILRQIRALRCSFKAQQDYVSVCRRSDSPAFGGELFLGFALTSRLLAEVRNEPNRTKAGAVHMESEQQVIVPVFCTRDGRVTYARNTLFGVCTLRLTNYHGNNEAYVHRRCSVLVAVLTLFTAPSFPLAKV